MIGVLTTLLRELLIDIVSLSGSHILGSCLNSLALSERGFGCGLILLGLDICYSCCFRSGLLLLHLLLLLRVLAWTTSTKEIYAVLLIQELGLVTANDRHIFDCWLILLLLGIVTNDTFIERRVDRCIICIDT